MQSITFPTAAAVTNAMATLPAPDRVRCLARQTTDGFVVSAPDDLATALRADHPEAPLPPVITYKADIYRRCTDAEADAMEMALMAATTKRRRLFETVEYLDASDPDFAFLREAFVEMFGTERSTVLLAAS